MKVLILGPVANKKISGGVAIFDEGLMQGFRDIGVDSNIISIEKSDKFDNFVIKTRNKKPNSIFFKFRKIAKIIKKEKPNLVISSLHYSLGISTYKRIWPHAKYVHILHGTPCSINGKIKAFFVNIANRYAKKKFDKLVTVSHLSWAINKKINRVTCDAIINTGSSFANIEPTANFREYDFCYVGRLYRDKNLEILMDSLIEFQKDTKIKVCIAGYGEQENFFKANGKYALPFIEFVGKIDHEKTKEIYLKSKFFISLCELEACGLSFSEAAICGCNPIASLSSGQSQFFLNKDYYHIANAQNVENLVKDLKTIFKKYKEIDKKEILELKEIFSYKNIAKKYIDLFEWKENENGTIS